MKVALKIKNDFETKIKMSGFNGVILEKRVSHLTKSATETSPMLFLLERFVFFLLSRTPPSGLLDFLTKTTRMDIYPLDTTKIKIGTLQVFALYKFGKKSQNAIFYNHQTCRSLHQYF